MEILILVFVLLFIVIGFLIFVKNNKNKPAPEKEDTFPYFKIPALLTPAELSFYHVLKIAVSEQYDIFAKVRLADLVSVKKGVDRAVWGKHFNKIKAKHIDFILCEKNTSEILCAIELDDQSHSQIKRQERDEFVTKVLDVVTLPFARFDVTRTYQSDAVKKHIQLAIAPEVIVKVTDNPSIKVLIEPDIDALNITTERKCPKCRGELVLRKFTRGQKKGHSFWGCSNFPQCRYMVDTL